MTVVLWVEAGGAQGFGGLARAIAMAEALQARGAACRFVVPDDAEVRGWLATAGITDAVFVGAPGAALAAVRRAAAVADAIVIDVRHALTRTDVEALRRRWPVLVLDNDGAGAAHADLVVASQGAASGPGWLVGPAFLPLRRPVTRGGLRRVGPGGRPVVLVCMGTRDLDGAAIPVVEALGRLERPRVTAHVVANPRSPVWEALPGRLGRLGFPPAHAITPGVIAPHLAAADFAVLRFGVTVFEALAAGVPSIVLCGSPAEERQAEVLAARGAIVSLGLAPTMEQIAAAAEPLARDRNLRVRMAQAGKTLVDGRGAERVADRLIATIDGGEAALAGRTI